MTWQHWEHNEEIHFVQTKYFLWLRYQGVSLKQRRLFLSWSWNCLSCSHVISVPTDLRHLHFLSGEKLRQKAAHRNKQSEDVFAFQNIRKYELSLVFRYMFWRACLRLQREKQRYKTYVKCRDINPMFVCLDVCIHQHQLTCTRAASEQKISVPTGETGHFTKWPRHTPPSDYLETVIKKHAHKITFPLHLSPDNAQYHTLSQKKTFFVHSFGTSCYTSGLICNNCSYLSLQFFHQLNCI